MQLSACQFKFTYKWHFLLSPWFTSLNESTTYRRLLFSLFLMPPSRNPRLILLPPMTKTYVRKDRWCSSQSWPLTNARSSSTLMLTFNIPKKATIHWRCNFLQQDEPWQHWSWAGTSHPGQHRIGKACLQPEHLNNIESVDFLTFFRVQYHETDTPIEMQISKA